MAYGVKDSMWSLRGFKFDSQGVGDRCSLVGIRCCHGYGVGPQCSSNLTPSPELPFSADAAIKKKKERKEKGKNPSSSNSSHIGNKMASIQMCYFPFTKIKNDLLAMTVSTLQPHINTHPQSPSTEPTPWPTPRLGSPRLCAGLLVTKPSGTGQKEPGQHTYTVLFP